MERVIQDEPGCLSKSVTIEDLYDELKRRNDSEMASWTAGSEYMKLHVPLEKVFDTMQPVIASETKIDGFLVHVLKDSTALI